MKPLIYTAIALCSATFANAQANQSKPALSFNIDSFNRESKAYLAEQLKSIDTVALKNRIKDVAYKPSLSNISKEEFDKILQALKNSTNPGIHVPAPSLDNMPIINKTKDGITYTIRVKTPKTENVEPK
jgi:hypothetical protein